MAETAAHAHGPATHEHATEDTIERSMWPMVLSGGVTLIAFGMVTSYVFSVVGVVVLAVGLFGWMGELRR